MKLVDFIGQPVEIEGWTRRELSEDEQNRYMKLGRSLADVIVAAMDDGEAPVVVYASIAGVLATAAVSIGAPIAAVQATIAELMVPMMARDAERERERIKRCSCGVYGADVPHLAGCPVEAKE